MNVFEKIIERLNEIYIDYEYEENSGFIEMCIDAVNQVAEEYNHCALCYLQSPCEYQNEDINVLSNDGWIPVTKRFPEEIFKDYLVCLKNGAIFIAQYSTKNEFRMVCTNAIQYFYKENPVIAWKPLPESYEPKGEKK